MRILSIAHSANSIGNQRGVTARSLSGATTIFTRLAPQRSFRRYWAASESVMTWRGGRSSARRNFHQFWHLRPQSLEIGCFRDRIINRLFGKLGWRRIALEHFKLLLDHSRKTCSRIYKDVQCFAGECRRNHAKADNRPKHTGFCCFVPVINRKKWHSLSSIHCNKRKLRVYCKPWKLKLAHLLSSYATVSCC
jgi:hypothetical protein